LSDSTIARNVNEGMQCTKTLPALVAIGHPFIGALPIGRVNTQAFFHQVEAWYSWSLSGSKAVSRGCTSEPISRTHTRNVFRHYILCPARVGNRKCSGHPAMFVCLFVPPAFLTTAVQFLPYTGTSTTTKITFFTNKFAYILLFGFQKSSVYADNRAWRYKMLTAII